MSDPPAFDDAQIKYLDENYGGASAQNVHWMIFNGVLVFLMQCGFAMLCAGSVRAKNAQNILLKNLVDTCVGAMGFWAALSKVYPETEHQRCWVHKTANVLNKLPKSVQPKVKADLHEIWMAETRDEAHKAFDRTLKRFEAKYPKAMACLAKDRESLLAFYDYPAEHWVHIRTTNPIESTFATVRLRTKRSRNCGSRDTTLAMVFKLLQSAQKRWRRIKHSQKLELVVSNVKFQDGEQVTDQSDRTVA